MLRTVHEKREKFFKALNRSAAKNRTQMTQMNMINADNSRKILSHHNYQRHQRSIVFSGLINSFFVSFVDIK